jgi:hypothetical protein
MQQIQIKLRTGMGCSSCEWCSDRMLVS